MKSNTPQQLPQFYLVLKLLRLPYTCLKIAKSFFRSAILILVLFFYFNPAFSQINKLSYFDSTGTMPSFRFYLPNGTVFTPDSLSNKNITVLIYFKPDCPFCENEAEIISKNINDFQSTDFVFITRYDTASIRYFAAIHKLDNNKKVKFVQDKEKLYYKFYIAHYTPSIHIYDENKKLKLFTQDMLTKDELLKYIQ